MDPNLPGVYEISTPRINDLVYYGSAARSISRRWAKHKHELRNGKHGNPRLQAIFRKYGLSVLEFRVLENCASSAAVATEQRYLDKCPKEKRYNINPVAESRLGARLSDEQKMRLAASHGGIGSIEILSQIVTEYEMGSSQAELARKFCVDRASIRNYLRRMRAQVRPQPIRNLQLQRAIAEEYDGGKTIEHLALTHVLDQETVCRMLKKSGVRLRSNSNRQLLRFETNAARRKHAQAKGGKIYRFIHRVHGQFIGYPFELVTKFGLRGRGNLHQVIKGNRDAYHGWELARSGKVHKWKCPEGGKVRNLNAKQVAKVRELLQQGERQSSIAAKFNIDQSSISRIKTGAYRYAI